MSKKGRDKELLELKDILEADRKEVIEQLKKLEDSTGLNAEELAGDLVDVASVEMRQTSLTKLGNRLRSKLKKIEHALGKFEDGSYGICEHTGEEIPIARLRVRPFTQYTVEAKEELERLEKKFRDKSKEEDENDPIPEDIVEES